MSKAKQNYKHITWKCICLWWAWRWGRRENFWNLRDRAQKRLLRSHFSFPIQRFFNFSLSSFPRACMFCSLKRCRRPSRAQCNYDDPLQYFPTNNFCYWILKENNCFSQIKVLLILLSTHSFKNYNTKKDYFLDTRVLFVSFNQIWKSKKWVFQFKTTDSSFVLICIFPVWKGLLAFPSNIRKAQILQKSHTFITLKTNWHTRGEVQRIINCPQFIREAPQTHLVSLNLQWFCSLSLKYPFCPASV